MAVEQFVERESFSGSHTGAPGEAATQPQRRPRWQSSPQACQARRMARGLGWFSIGLGLAEVLAPRRLAKLIGVREHPLLMRMMGLREIGAGLGIFSQITPTQGMWARVAGDVVDLTCLGAALVGDTESRGRVAAATLAVAGVTLADIGCAQELSRISGVDTGIRVEKTMAVNKSPAECYAFWHDFANLGRIMTHLEFVRPTGPQRSHWVAKAPAGTHVEWDAEIVEDRPDELIAWRSLPGADVNNSGSVRFEKAPGGRGTLVRVILNYDPPGRAVGAVLAKLFGEEPEMQVAKDLLHFKQLLETGEIATTAGQPAGRSEGETWLDRMAR